MTPPQWHPLRLQTTTPAFLGRYPDLEATQKEIPFPVPSLRGVLAYWLRALAGPCVGNNISELLRLEGDLFGEPAGAGPSRPSRILLRGDRIQTMPPGKPGSDLLYLMGPGLIEDKKLPAERKPPPRRLAPSPLHLDVKNLGRPEHADLFLCALWALRAFGGIGARSRRGFGTLALAEDQAPALKHSERFKRAWLLVDRLDHLDNVLACVADALRELGFPDQGFGEDQPRYPCLASGWFRFDERLLPGSRVEEVLGQVGKALRGFRHPKPPGWTPPPGKPYVLPSTEGYRKVVTPFVDHTTPTWPFVDGALGLPIVYTVKGTTWSPDISVTVEPVDGTTPTRRASPLWLRVSKLPGGWRLRSLAFHSEWLPENLNLRVKTANADAPVVEPTPEQIRARLDSWFDQLPNTLNSPGTT
jgi:CRISPR-associated protein Cmr1